MSNLRISDGDSIHIPLQPDIEWFVQVNGQIKNPGRYPYQADMNLKQLKLGVKLSKKYYETEASGGITLKNVKKVASTGVSRISVGTITHGAPTINFKLQI